VNDDHPKEWAITRLGDLFEFNYGKGLTQENRNNKGRINVYGSNGVVGTHDAALTNGVTIIIGRKCSKCINISSECILWS
jgi:type I restriction enzyme, S subunit